jgi:capsular exopolysaccharide synthesis family protein
MFEPRDPRHQPTGQPHQQGRLPVSSGGADDIHLLDRLSAIYRHRRLVVSVFAIVVTLMMLQSYSTIPLFRATARVQIDDEQSVLVTGLDTSDPVYWTDPEPYFETQYRIIRSPGLAQYTVKQLNLSTVADFSGEAPVQFGPLQAVRVARETVMGWARTVGTSALGYIRPDAVTPATPPLDEDEVGDEPLADADDADAHIGAFVSRIAVSPVVNTRLVDIMFTSTDPVFAAEAINAHVQTYVERNLERRLETVQQTLEWVTGQLETQQAAVESSELALADYRESQDALSLNASTDIISTTLARISSEMTQARTVRAQKESLYNQVRDLDPNSQNALSFPAVARSQGVTQVTATVTQLEAERAQLATRYLEQHPEMVRINSEIANANRQVTTAVRNAIRAVETDYQSALSEEQRLQSEFDQQKLRAEDLSRKNVRYSSLERQSESNQRVYENLLTQQNELQVVANSRSNNVQLMDLAQVPGGPFTPNTRRDWMTAVMVGLMFAVGLVVVVEYLDDTLKTPDDVSRRLHLPLLGLVPAVRGERPPLLTEADVPHDFGEAFRSLRTALVFTSGSSSSRVIGVTSTQPLEGKTTTAVNLALVLAIGGARVLLIDGDMRRPSVHKSLGMANSVGLSHVLVGQARIREAIQRTHDPNLFALTGGQPPPNPSELLASDRMRSLLTSLETGPFDWIVVDTPPVLAVTDCVILAPLMSGMVFVAGAEMTRAAHAERATEMLRAGGNANVIGVVLNRVDFARNKYYYSRYYGYHYKSYYGDSSAAA